MCLRRGLPKTLVHKIKGSIDISQWEVVTNKLINFQLSVDIAIN